jgi:PAS domain S-box-containing protein
MKVSIRTRVVLGFVLMVALIIVTGVAGYVGLRSAIEQAELYRTLAIETSVAGRLESHVLLLHNAVDEYFISGDQQAIWDFDYQLALTKRVVKQVNKGSATAQTRAILEEVDDSLKRTEKNFQRLRELDARRNEIQSSDAADKTDLLKNIAVEKQDVHESCEFEETRIANSVESARESIKTRQEAIDSKLQESFRVTTIVVATAGIAEAVIALLVASLFVRLITRPIGVLEQIVRRSPSVAFRFGSAPPWPVDYVSENVRQLGYSLDDFYSGRKSFVDMVHPEDLEMVMTKLREYSRERDQTEFSREYRVITGAHETRWMDERMWVMPNDKGQIAHFEGILLDITERKEAEQNLAREQAARASIRETFGSYLSEEVVNEILESPEGINLGGEMRDITVLVSDLRGFTSMTESLGCRHVLEIINRYLETMTEIVLRHGGTIDEFMGDGILVFFGAPRPFPDHFRRGIRCAIDMQAAMEEFNKEGLRLGQPPLQMGIGINCGELIVGNIGSHKRKKYGAVGSPINVAFRVEAQTTGGEILVTPAIFNRLSEELVVGTVRQTHLKGLDGPVALYPIVALKTAENSLG